MPSVSPAFAVLVIALSALCAITGAFLPGRRGRLLHWLFKPLTTILVLALLVPFPSLSTAYGLAVALGLLLSLSGDVFLMLPGDRFLGGLGSFLLAHVAYVVAFAVEVGPLPSLPAALVALTVAVAALPVLWPGVPRRLRVPVGAYVLVLCAMAAQAAGRAEALGTEGALGAAAGAAVFVASDATLAFDRFRLPFRAAPAVVLSTYWAAQVLIALSVRGAG